MQVGVGIMRDETLKRRDLKHSDTLGCVGKHTVNLVLVVTEVEVVGLVRLSWVVWGTGTPKDRVENVMGEYTI